MAELFSILDGGKQRGFNEAVRTNEQWLKAFWDPWFKAGNPERKETAKVKQPGKVTRGTIVGQNITQGP